MAETSDMGGMMPSQRDGRFSLGAAQRQNAGDEPNKPPSSRQQYLDAQKTGLTVEKGLDAFYGYYTVHSLDEPGNTVGMV